MMAHFAKLGPGNVVEQVIVVDNRDTADASGVEKEHIGAAFCERLLGGRWVQTSYNGNKRKNYAASATPLTSSVMRSFRLSLLQAGC